MLAVYKHITRVDEYIIKINHNTSIQKIKEYVTSLESSLLFVTFRYADQMIYMVKIYFSIYLGFLR